MCSSAGALQDVSFAECSQCRSVNLRATLPRLDIAWASAGFRVALGVGRSLCGLRSNSELLDAGEKPGAWPDWVHRQRRRPWASGKPNLMHGKMVDANAHS